MTGEPVSSGAGVLGSILLGNTRSDYDIVGNLKTDVSALQELLKGLSQGAGIDDALNKIKQSFTVSDEFERFAKGIDATGKSFNQLATQYIPQYITNVTGATSLSGKFTQVLGTIGSTALSMGAQLVTSFAIGAAINLAIAGLMQLGEVINDVLHPEEALDEKILDISGTVSDYTSEIDALQSELDSTNEKIAELSNADAGTFVDQQELDNLKAVTVELQNQIKLKQMLRAEEATELNNTVIERANLEKSHTIGGQTVQASSYLTGGGSVRTSSYGAGPVGLAQNL